MASIQCPLLFNLWVSTAHKFMQAHRQVGSCTHAHPPRQCAVQVRQASILSPCVIARGCLHCLLLGSKLELQRAVCQDPLPNIRFHCNHLHKGVVAGKACMRGHACLKLAFHSSGVQEQQARHGSSWNRSGGLAQKRLSACCAGFVCTCAYAHTSDPSPRGMARATTYTGCTYIRSRASQSTRKGKALTAETLWPSREAAARACPPE